MQFRSFVLGVVCSSVGLFAAHSHAQSSSYQDEYMQRLKAYQTIQPHGDSPFGEELNLYTGELSFTQTDIVLEGTGPDIRVSRSRSGSGIDETSGEVPPAQNFGDWKLNLPRIDTLVAAPRSGTGTPGTNWRMTNLTDAPSLARCTNFGMPYIGQSGISHDEWWHGYEVVMDDGSRQALLKRDAGYATKPAGPGDFLAVTTSSLQMTCLPTTTNGQSGEGFLAFSPDGTKYWFDWLVGNQAFGVREDIEGTGVHAEQKRMQASMFVTRVEDRFGNSLSYAYNGMQLASITGSDGRLVTFAWSGDKIATMTAQPTSTTPRVWQYQYSDGKLTSVVLPDASRWSLNLGLIGGGSAPEPTINSCSLRYNANTPYIGGAVASVTAPTGLVGSFVIQSRWHARSYAASYCVQTPTNSYELVSPMYSTSSLHERTLSGPGLPTKTWQYRYPPAIGSTASDACAANSTCPDTKWVEIVEPDGRWTRYTSSNRWGALEGKLVKKELFDASNALQRTETVTYTAPANAPYQAHIGTSLLGYNVNEAKLEHLTPVQQRVITQQSRVFTWQVDSTCASGLCFDGFARPTQITRSSASTP